MHTHDDNPCWDAHCAPHHIHHDPAVRALVAREVDAERERIAQAIEAGVLPSHPNSGYRDGFARAAQIAREVAW